jgi:signal transduction histidine kinase
MTTLTDPRAPKGRRRRWFELPPPSELRARTASKTFLGFVAVALLIVFGFFAFGSYGINQLQRANVEDAVQLAQDQATEVARRVSEVLAQRPLQNPTGVQMEDEISGLLEFNLRLNRNVTWIGFFDDQGNCVVERNSMGETIVRLPENAGEPHSIELPTGVPGQTAQLTVTRRTATQMVDDREIRETIVREGVSKGEIRMKIAESPVYQRMAAASRDISIRLMVGSGLLFVFLLGVYMLLSYLAFREVQSERRAERAQRMAYVGTLASGLAHEIRNPLNSMSINLQVMQEDLEETREVLARQEASGDGEDPGASAAAAQRALDLASRIQKEITGLGTTLSHFLEFALPNKEGMTEFGVRGLLEELVELHRAQCQRAGVSLELLGASSQQTVIEADRRLCHQAFRNILINAIQILEDHIPRQIRIRVEPRGDKVEVKISDTGPGIPEDMQETLFEAFVSGRKGGTGLGLALTRKIIEEHHGTISVTNNTPEPGATFVIVLPVCQPG